MPNIAGEVLPLGTSFAVATATNIKGAVMTVADLTARDGIPDSRRVDGMEVKVRSTGLKYSLGTDLMTWTEVIVPPATSFDRGLVKPDGVTCTVDIDGKLSVFLPVFSTLGSVTASVDESGETVLSLNWDGTITNWESIDLENDAAVVTVGILDSAVATAQSFAIQRDNHTGSQIASTITDFAEAVDDRIAVLLGAGSNVTLTYNDAAGTLTVDSTGGGSTDPEAVRDAIGIALVGAGVISVAVNDGADTITISSTATVNSTDAALRDRSTHTGTQAWSTLTSTPTTLAGYGIADAITAAAAAAAYQPLDSDLTAIAALSTTSFGRSTLELADASAGRTLLGLGTAATTAASAYEASGAITTERSAIRTLTNARITQRVHTLTDAATVTPDIDSYDGGKLTTLSQTTTFANPTGTPTPFQTYVLRITSSTARAISFGSQYRGSTDLPLPTFTSGGGLTDYIGIRWNVDATKWDFVSKNFGF